MEIKFIMMTLHTMQIARLIGLVVFFVSRRIVVHYHKQQLVVWHSQPARIISTSLTSTSSESRPLLSRLSTNTQLDLIDYSQQLQSHQSFSRPSLFAKHSSCLFIFISNYSSFWTPPPKRSSQSIENSCEPSRQTSWSIEQQTQFIFAPEPERIKTTAKWAIGRQTWNYTSNMSEL